MAQGIREKMGAVDDACLPELSIGGISLSEIKKLKSGSISIDNIHEHINPIDGTFDYKGQKVIPVHQATTIQYAKFFLQTKLQISFMLLLYP